MLCPYCNSEVGNNLGCSECSGYTLIRENVKQAEISRQEETEEDEE